MFEFQTAPFALLPFFFSSDSSDKSIDKFDPVKSPDEEIKRSEWNEDYISDSTSDSVDLEDSEGFDNSYT